MSSLFGIAAGGPSGFYGFIINQSLRFNEASEAYLRKTDFSGSPTSEQTGTFSVWVKNTLSYSNNRNAIYGSSTGSAAFTSLALSGDTQELDLRRRNTNSSDVIDIIGNPAQRDPSAWYHIMSVYDMTNSTQADRAQIYVNGVRVTDLGTNTLPSNTTTEYYSGDFISDMQIGRTNTNSSNMLYADFILAEYHRVDGQALSPTSFGETKSGVWIPKQYTGSYGNHGFHLDFADTSDIGKDVSGNGNDFTPNNLSAHDIVIDSPTNNFSTFNQLEKHSATVFSEGNLVSTSANSNDWESVGTTTHVSSGKWYCEVALTAASGTLDLIIGVARSQSFSFLAGTTFYTPANNYGYYASAGDVYAGGSVDGDFNVTYAVGDIIGIAIDMDNLAVYFAKNNTYINSGDPTSGASKTGLSGALQSGTSYQVAVGAYQSGTKFSINFGQDGTFTNTKTAQGNADANGIGNFFYAPPSGYLAICSSNLPEPSITPLDDDIPEDYFNTVLYDGASAIVNVTGVGFSPDFLWLKRRNASSTNHKILDTVRGSGQALESNNTGSESDESANFSSFDSDGFTLANVGAGAYNVNGGTFVSWNWLAGTAFSNDASATGVGSIDSEGQVNTKAGFAIIKYTGTNSSSETIAHGLGKVPDMIIVKQRNSSSNFWSVYHSGNTSAPETDLLRLNTTNGTLDGSVYWNDTAPTSSIFTVGTSSALNASGNYIAYLFNEVEGYSRFGSYTGNGDPEGVFVFTGFKPAFVIIKQTSASGNNWNVIRKLHLRH